MSAKQDKKYRRIANDEFNAKRIELLNESVEWIQGFTFWNRVKFGFNMVFKRPVMFREKAK
jgi:hypothetical protein